jgi:TonB family protein
MSILSKSFIAWAVAVPFACAMAAPAAADCPMDIWMADFRAIGSVHRSAEYVLALDLPDDRLNRTYSVTFSAGADQGKEQTAFTMDGLTFDHQAHEKNGTAAIIVILPSAGIRWVGIKSVSDNAGSAADCSATTPFDLSSDLLGSFESFDDGSTGTNTKPVVARLEGLQILKIVQPDYPTQAQDQNMQGEAKVLFTVHGDGSRSDYTVFKSSGYDLLDQEAIRAAKLMRVSPARLPASMGGTTIDVKYIIDFSWALDQ